MTWIYSCAWCDKEFKGSESDRKRLWAELEAHEETHRKPDQTRYAEHAKLGAGWKDPSKGYGGPR